MDQENLYMTCDRALKRILREKGNFYKSESFQEGFREGFLEGFREGFRKGRVEALIEVSRRMKQEGMNIEDIAGYTGLAMSEISDL